MFKKILVIILFPFYKLYTIINPTIEMRVNKILRSNESFEARCIKTIALLSKIPYEKLSDASLMNLSVCYNKLDQIEKAREVFEYIPFNEQAIDTEHIISNIYLSLRNELYGY